MFHHLRATHTLHSLVILSTNTRTTFRTTGKLHRHTAFSNRELKPLVSTTMSAYYEKTLPDVR
jgi:hypothetical protein